MKKTSKNSSPLMGCVKNRLCKFNFGNSFSSIKIPSAGVLYLLVVAFVFIATFSISISGPKIGERVEMIFLGSDKKINEDLPPIPVLKENADDFPVISSQAALAIDLDSQVPLYEKDPDKKLLPASTTKIMSAIVALNYYRDDDVLVVGKTNSSGQKMGLSFGERYKAISLIESLLIYSANDAVETLAENYIGGERAFVQRMNAKARELRLVNTNFENAVGYDGSNQYSTARDLVRVAEVAMKDPKFSAIVATKSKIISDLDGKRTFSLNSTNELLESVDGVIGVKTGWTENARENLVTYVERDGKRVLIAILGSSDRFGETKELIDWIFTNYEWQKVEVY